MALSGLTVHLARAVVAVEHARREAEHGSPRRDEGYELTFAAKWLQMAITKHCAREHVDAQAFQALVEQARIGFEGMPS